MSRPTMRVTDDNDSIVDIEDSDEEDIIDKSNKKCQKRYDSEETDTEESYTDGTATTNGNDGTDGSTGSKSDDDKASGEGTTSAVSENEDGDYEPNPEWQAIIARRGGRGRKDMKTYKDQGVNTVLNEGVLPDKVGGMGMGSVDKDGSSGHDFGANVTIRDKKRKRVDEPACETCISKKNCVQVIINVHDSNSKIKVSVEEEYC
ncbi:hypothetical protein CVT24_011657 [Panaeolus cyanescens]|uniref:Uncharacterized protein n=1 Tax=Panaeolus cyanescens TaxID=181874 RepID=A0A409WE74_9AGAR|nr:hypothetical protein CVT24_011657 [Panaeolus cyanescens]